MIYISGAITETDDYMERFEAAEKELTEEGYTVVNPAKVNAQMPPLDYNGYMSMSIAMLNLCDAIYMLDGWESSKGARLEHVYAETMGIHIVYQTPKQEEKKYHWRLKLNGALNSHKYLNRSVYTKEVMVHSAIESYSYKTRFTETEYKTYAEKFHFSENMFVKVEIK